MLSGGEILGELLMMGELRNFLESAAPLVAWDDGKTNWSNLFRSMRLKRQVRMTTNVKKKSF